MAAPSRRAAQARVVLEVASASNNARLEQLRVVLVPARSGDFLDRDQHSRLPRGPPRPGPILAAAAAADFLADRRDRDRPRPGPAATGTEVDLGIDRTAGPDRADRTGGTGPRLIRADQTEVDSKRMWPLAEAGTRLIPSTGTLRAA